MEDSTELSAPGEPRLSCRVDVASAAPNPHTFAEGNATVFLTWPQQERLPRSAILRAAATVFGTDSPHAAAVSRGGAFRHRLATGVPLC